MPETTFSADSGIVQANQTLGLSSASLGVAVLGAIFQPALAVATAPVVLYLSVPTFQLAYNTLRQDRRITAPVLDALRVTVCMAMGYWSIAALDVWLRAVSQKISAYRAARYQQQLIDLVGLEQAPLWQYARDAEIAVAPEDLSVGDVIVLSAGDFVPADGTVLYGTALVDQRLISGEIELIEKQPGDTVAVATMVQAGRLYVQLATPVSAAITTHIRTALNEAVSDPSFFQTLGERSSDRMAPGLLLAFALTLPLIGVNRAAAFLCAGFGGHMRALGPQAVQEYAAQAMQQGILIKDSRALETALLINTVIIDARLLEDPTLRAEAKETIHQLRQRRWLVQNVVTQPFAVHLMGVEDESRTHALAQEIGADDYFVEPLASGRAAILERLQAGGRQICYVGDGVEDAAVMEKAVVSISMRSAATIDQDSAQILFGNRDFAALGHFFKLSDRFVSKQGFSFVAPIVIDLIDIGTTLVFHFGLVYSVLFNYTSLLLSAANLRTIREQSNTPESSKPESSAASETEMPNDAARLLLSS